MSWGVGIMFYTESKMLEVFSLYFSMFYQAYGDVGFKLEILEWLNELKSSAISLAANIQKLIKNFH